MLICEYTNQAHDAPLSAQIRDTFRSVSEQEYELFEYKGSQMATLHQNKATK